MGGVEAARPTLRAGLASDRPASQPGYLELGTQRRPLSRVFFARTSPEVAPSLLGKLLVRREGSGPTIVARLVEVEAYREDDPASHSYRGPTERNAIMFGAGGHLYVYFTYGMHHCMNVSCEQEGFGSAVLLRAAVVLEGREPVRARRGSRHPDRDLLRGPGRLSAGLAVDRTCNGLDLLDPSSPLRIEDDGWEPDPAAVATGPRIGIRAAVDTPWRYWLEGVAEVSRYVRHPRAGR